MRYIVRQPPGSTIIEAPTPLKSFDILAPMRSGMLGKRLYKDAIGRKWLGFVSSNGLSTRAARQAGATAASKTLKNGAEGADVIKSKKAQSLEKTLADLNMKFGKHSIMKMSSKETMDIERISTGALTLDIALGGGFPKGRIIEIFGPESSGKTTLALQAIASEQANGGTAVLIDAEHAFDPKYAKRAGVNVEDLLISQPECGETALEIVDQMVKSSSVDIIVVDSVAALVPRAELEGEIGDKQMGTQARMMSQAMRKIAGNASKCNVTVIFINQLRMKIGVVYGNPEVTTGGNALKFFCSVRVDVRRAKAIEGPKQEQIGIRVKAKVVKNKCAPPFKICEFDIYFASGISSVACIVDAAEKMGILTRKGAWYSYNGDNIGQGKEKTVANLVKDKQLQQEIEAKTRAALVDIDINEIVDDNVQQGWEADDDEAGFDGLEADNDVDEDLLASGAAMDGSSDTVLP